MVIAYAGEKKQLQFDVDILKYITFINRSFSIARIDPSPNVLTVTHHGYIMVPYVSVTSWLHHGTLCLSYIMVPYVSVTS